MATLLGEHQSAVELNERTQALKQRIQQQLWDSDRQVFANRLWSGEFVRSLAPTSFFPLLAGAASAQQAQTLIERYLFQEDRFGGQWLLPSVSRDDAAFGDNMYWRGRIWPPLNFLTYQGR